MLTFQGPPVRSLSTITLVLHKKTNKKKHKWHARNAEYVLLLTYTQRQYLKTKWKDCSRMLADGFYLLLKFYFRSHQLDTLKNHILCTRLEKKVGPLLEGTSLCLWNKCSNRRDRWGIPVVTSHTRRHKKPFRELRTLSFRAQLVVTLRVKRCFRPQSAVQPSDASTKSAARVRAAILRLLLDTADVLFCVSEWASSGFSFFCFF